MELLVLVPRSNLDILGSNEEGIIQLFGVDNEVLNRIAKRTHVDESGCWIYVSGKARYSTICYGGNKHKLVHRTVYELVVGAIPEYMVVMHTCDNTHCVCPAHLKVGTVKENNTDRTNKNRNGSPKNTINTAKINFQQAEEARRRYKAGESMGTLSRYFGISIQSMSRIMKNQLHTTGVLFVGGRNDWDRLMDMRIINEESGCWEILRDNRYGRIMINSKQKAAHRVSYELFNKCTLKEGEKVLHKCDNKYCIRPEHLFKGTIKDNTIDMMKKGRHPIQKLIPKKVEEIRGLLNENKTIVSIARLYGVSRTAIHSIKSGTTWAHVQ